MAEYYIQRNQNRCSDPVDYKNNRSARNAGPIKGEERMKKVTVLVLGITLVAMTTLAFAEDVYATKNGKKYHKEDCRLIKSKNPQKISKEEALSRGLVPCSKCFKEDTSAANLPKDQKQSLKVSPDQTQHLSLQMNEGQASTVK